MPPSGINEQKLLALGRFTWSAMRLEAFIDVMCDRLVPGSIDKGMVGNHVAAVVKGLPSPTPLQSRAIQWLRAADGALEGRNAVLHGVLRASYVGDTPVPEDQFEWDLVLLHAKSKTRTPFTTEGLAAAQSALDSIYVDGLILDGDLARIRL